ncbi:MAG: flagellar motor switch protein FliG, partial [Halanaerobiales bacterium]
MDYNKLTGKQKAAILLVAMGPDVSATVFKHLNDEEIEELTLEIANLRSVEKELKDQVLEEFYELCQAHDYINQGGIEYAREVLEKAVGKERANSILERLTATLQVRPFDAIRRTDPSQLMNFIHGEHPQTIAMIMA